MNAPFEKARCAITVLASLGYDTSSLTSELTKRELAEEHGVPSEWDLRYTLPDAPPSLGSHFENEKLLIAGLSKEQKLVYREKIVQKPQELAPHVMWMGYHYSLTPGQRRWFREFTGMTPSATVTVSWVESWKGTKHPRSFKVVSDQHVDPRLRRHTIVEMVIRDAGKFFSQANEFDMEEVSTKVLSLHVGPVNTWSSRYTWAVKDMTGITLGDKDYRVDIIFVDNTNITFTDAKNRTATVDRDEFLATVADYERLYDKKVTKAKTPKSTVSNVADLMAELERGLAL